MNGKKEKIENIFHSKRNMIKLSDWERKTGVDFLKKAEMKKGDTILDFGCNDGNYTIPAGILAGENGIVFAIDENEHSLRKIADKAELLKLDNIKTINSNGDLSFDFADNFFDFIMLYDVLHYLSLQQRKTLFKEILRILKNNSILSVHPKHIIGNFPLMELRNITLNQLINEIELSGFKYHEKICSRLSHDDHLEDGCILNFTK